MYTKVFFLDASHSGTHLEPQNSEGTDGGWGVGGGSSLSCDKVQGQHGLHQTLPQRSQQRKIKVTSGPF